MWWLPLAAGAGSSILGSLFGKKPGYNIPQLPGQLQGYKPTDYSGMRDTLYKQAQQNLESAFQTGRQGISESAAARGTYQSGLPSLGESIMRKGMEGNLANIGSRLSAQGMQMQGQDYQNYLNRLLSSWGTQVGAAGQKAGMGQQQYGQHLQGLGGFGEGMGGLSQMMLLQKLLQGQGQGAGWGGIGGGGAGRFGGHDWWGG